MCKAATGTSTHMAASAISERFTEMTAQLMGTS
jgi:hypothetical protein